MREVDVDVFARHQELRAVYMQLHVVVTELTKHMGYHCQVWANCREVSGKFIEDSFGYGGGSKGGGRHRKYSYSP